VTHDDLRKIYRQGILLASAGALLHNLGKVSSRFVEMQCDQLCGSYFYQHIPGLFLDDCYAKGTTADTFLGKYKFKPNRTNDEKNLGKSDDVTDKVLHDETKMLLKGTNISSLPNPFDDRTYRIGDLIEYLSQGEPFYAKTNGGSNYLIEKLFSSSSLLTHLMNRCHHGASGGDKQDIYTLKQKFLPLYMATPLGYERPAPDLKLYDEIKEKVEKIIQEYLDSNNLKDPFPLGELARKLEEYLCRTLGDTQRGINDVTVWDIGHSGMAFLKAGIWSCASNKTLTHDDLVGGWSTNHPRWRLWRVGLNGLDFLTGAVSVADLRVRQRVLKDYLDAVKHFAEEEYPVATEVYRDENGGIYVFPDWKKNSPEYETFAQELKKSLSEETRKNLSLPELYGICPAYELSEHNYHNHPECKKWSSKPANITGGYIGEKVRQWIEEPPAAVPVFESYPNDLKTDLCPYCGVRPIGGGSEELLKKLPEDEQKRCSAEKAGQRKVCRLCLGSRGWVAREWWEKENFSTIWVDEVADINGRVALVVGKFGVEKMLEELIYPIKGKTIYKVLPHYHSSSGPFLAPCTILKIDGKDCTWDGTSLVAPAGLGRYKQQRIKVVMFDGQNTNEQIAIHRAKKDPATGKLVISLADDCLLTVAKHVGRGDTWEKIIGKHIKAINKGLVWTITDIREISLDNARQADDNFKKLLHSLDVPGKGSPYYCELDQVTIVGAAPSESFARFRRVWETTAGFWREVAPIKDSLKVQVENWRDELAGCLAVEALAGEGKRRRLVIRLKNLKNPGSIAPFHAYELEVAGISIGIVPTVEVQGDRVTCITIENLGYIAVQLGAPKRTCTDPCAAANWVLKWLLSGSDKEKSRVVRIKAAHGYGHGKEDCGTANIDDVRLAGEDYRPVIPVLANPRVFAVLLPANAAVELVQRIHRKYTKEMGKVRWRLPLTLGTVFFPRHLPLRIVLDAGWRLLVQERRQVSITAVVTDAKPAGTAVHDQLNHPSGSPWPSMVAVKVEVADSALDQHERQVRLCWEVPTMMGDSRTFDIWYPWVKLAAPNAPADRPLSFGHGSKTWLHVMELKDGDEIEFCPSMWDFVFLDSAGERFTISYDEKGRRLGLKRRPYYLEEIDKLVELWNHVRKGLNSAQLHDLWQTLLERYVRWALDNNGAAQPATANDKTWQRFCRDTLLNAGWKTKNAEILELIGEVLSESPSLDHLTGLTASGALFDLFELYMTILKEGE